MSRFLSARHRALVPYDTTGEHAPGEIRLNTNESPFSPSPRAIARAAEAAWGLNFYSDPDCRTLRAKAAQVLGLEPDEVLCGNGSDEILNFAVMAFCDGDHPAAFPGVTYSFYKVLAGFHQVPVREIPLGPGFVLRPEDCLGLGATLFLANPNSPTGLFLPVAEVERILAGNPENVVVVDEAYADFGAESCVPLIHRYGNLLVTRTFSKSRSLAGARLGFALGCPDLIRDLRAMKDSVAPYNVNAMTQAAGLGALEDEEAARRNCQFIVENREFTARAMRNLGFELTDSLGNFLLARHPGLDAGRLRAALKARGILVRGYGDPALAQYNRVTIGTRPQMEAFITALSWILEEGE